METKEIVEVDGARIMTVFVERLVDLPVAEVWKAWTEPESFKKWWGPAAYTCPYCIIDLKVGGKTLSCMREPEGKDFWTTATYQEIVPMKKIVYIDSFSDRKGNPVPPSYYELPEEVWGEEVKVTVTMEEYEGKTKMSVEQTGIPEEMYNDCIIGWKQSFDKMEVSLKK